MNLVVNENFFTLCTTNSNEMNSEIKSIEEFQEKNSENILIKNKFPLKFLTKSLHTRNFHWLYLFHLFLGDIRQQLIFNQCSISIHVYYSYLTTNEKFERLRNFIGKSISINAFFLTTFKREQALLILKQENDSKKILFEIFADPSINVIELFVDIR